MSRRSLIILIIIAVGIIGAVIWLEGLKPKQIFPGSGDVVEVADSAQTASKGQRYQKAREIVSPAGFINTNGIAIQELIGKKVILVDFWTYGCINCQRTLPYLTSWYDKYRESGLEIIGVHTPEFAFEKEIENVQWAVDKYGIKYPVVLDNDYGTWRNYQNRYWPRKYLIDIDGYIVYDHIGEGGYQETERKIQELLQERMIRLNENGSVASGSVAPENIEQTTQGQRSPEIYFGSQRNEHFGNGTSGLVGIQQLVTPADIRLNTLYLDGNWNIQGEYATNLSAVAKIIFRYQGQKVFIVASADSPVTVTVLRDGQPVGDAAGSDVIDGTVTIQEDRLYRLVEDSESFGEHILELIISQPALEAYTF